MSLNASFSFSSSRSRILGSKTLFLWVQPFPVLLSLSPFMTSSLYPQHRSWKILMEDSWIRGKWILLKWWFWYKNSADGVWGSAFLISSKLLQIMLVENTLSRKDLEAAGKLIQSTWGYINRANCQHWYSSRTKNIMKHSSQCKWPATPNNYATLCASFQIVVKYQFIYRLSMFVKSTDSGVKEPVLEFLPVNYFSLPQFTHLDFIGLFLGLQACM